MGSDMSVRGFASLIAAAALFSAAGVAHAADATAGKPVDFTVRTEPASADPAAGKTLKWDARKGHWGLTLNLQQPETRESNWNDVQAGAYYRITPSLRVGGAVAMGDQPLATPRPLTPADGAPRVRLETAFKF
jgi:hypothetical protein